MHRYPDGSIRLGLPRFLEIDDMLRPTSQLSAEDLASLGYHEAVPVQREPFKTYETRWTLDGLVYREEVMSYEVDTEALATAVRGDRTARLTACDWTQLPDAPLGTETRVAWATYRQALRDLPAQEGFPVMVEWPQAPAEQE